MTITKIDLLGKKFGRCMRGYCPDEVDLVIHDAAEALGEAADENRKLLERLAQLEKGQAQRPPDTPHTPASADLKGALAAGRKIVEDIHGNARREARQILEAARDEAARIKADANLLKAKVFEEIADLRVQRDAFEQEMRKLLEDHFRLLEATESVSRRGGAGEGDFIFADGTDGAGGTEGS